MGEGRGWGKGGAEGKWVFYLQPYPGEGAKLQISKINPKNWDVKIIKTTPILSIIKLKLLYPLKIKTIIKKTINRLIIKDSLRKEIENKKINFIIWT